MMYVTYLDHPLAEPHEVRADTNCPRRHHGHGHNVVVGLERESSFIYIAFLPAGAGLYIAGFS